MTAREFEIEFRRLYLPLGMYALRILGDAADAEDVVEDAFMKTWQALEDGLDVDNFKAYIYRAVRNECIGFLRRKKDVVGADHIPEVGEEDVDTSVRDAKIWEAVDKLPEKCREIFLMSKRDGMSNEEIADELSLSVQTVKNQLSKAFARMRDALSSGHKPFFLPFL